MQAPSGNQPITSRLRELGLVLPTPPTPLGAYVESSDAGNLLFLSGILPIADGKLAIELVRKIDEGIFLCMNLTKILGSVMNVL